MGAICKRKDLKNGNTGFPVNNTTGLEILVFVPQGHWLTFPFCHVYSKDPMVVCEISTMSTVKVCYHFFQM